VSQTWVILAVARNSKTMHPSPELTHGGVFGARKRMALGGVILRRLIGMAAGPDLRGSSCPYRFHDGGWFHVPAGFICTDIGGGALPAGQGQLTASGTRNEIDGGGGIWGTAFVTPGERDRRAMARATQGESTNQLVTSVSVSACLIIDKYIVAGAIRRFTKPLARWQHLERHPRLDTNPRHVRVAAGWLGDYLAQPGHQLGYHLGCG
jgi:hypothetical protein